MTQTLEKSEIAVNPTTESNVEKLGAAVRYESRTTRVVVHNVRELGALLRVARQRLNMSQTDAAICCGVGRRFYVELENGKETVRMEKVLAVLEALGLNLALGGPGMAFTTEELACAYVKQEEGAPEHIWDADFDDVVETPFEADVRRTPGRKSGSIAIQYRRKSAIRMKDGEIIRVEDPVQEKRRRRRRLSVEETPAAEGIVTTPDTIVTKTEA